MTKNLEGKIQAPTLVFAESIEFSAAGFGGIHLTKRDGCVLKSFTSFGYECVEAVYDSKGVPNWKNRNVKKYRKAKVPEHLRGTQVVLTNIVVYEGANMGGHHFSFLKDGIYVGHDHQQHLAVDFGYNEVKAILDREGKIVWENWNYKPT